MGFTKENLQMAPIWFCEENEVMVTVDTNSAKYWSEKSIPLDGRHYTCGGVIILKNKKELRASFEINTADTFYLNSESLYVYFDEIWFKWNEAELLIKLEINKEEAFPFFWKPDIPLDHINIGPYPMKWPVN